MTGSHMRDAFTFLESRMYASGAACATSPPTSCFRPGSRNDHIHTTVPAVHPIRSASTMYFRDPMYGSCNMKYLLCLAILCICTIGGTSQTPEPQSGSQAISDIHSGWLIVRLPGFERKLHVLDSILGRDDLNEKVRLRLQREQYATRVQKDFLYNWYPVVFDSVYRFSRHAVIYTHETAGFQKGEITARRSDGIPVVGLHDAPYVFATLDGVVGDPFHFTTRDHRAIAYPFPANISQPRVFAVFVSRVPDWVRAHRHKSEDAILAYLHVKRLNRKLEAYHKRTTRAR